MSYYFYPKLNESVRIIAQFCDSEFAFRGWHLYMVPVEDQTVGDYYYWLANTHLLYRIRRILGSRGHDDLPDVDRGYYALAL